MTPLPTRWRNAKDALREPSSVDAVRVRRTRAEWGWAAAALAAGGGFLGCRRSARLTRAPQAPAPERALRRPAAGPAASARQRPDVGGAIGERGDGHVGSASGAGAGAPSGYLPAGAAGSPSRRVRDRRVGHRYQALGAGAIGGRCTANSRGSTTRGAGGGGGSGRRRLGQRRVQRRRRYPFGGLRRPDDDPVAGRILDQVRGVARWNHAEFARRLGQGGCGLRLEYLTLERLLLLQQSLIDLPRVAELVGPLGGVGRQPQRDPEPDAERPDDQHDERAPW